jgi:hypothetical protein
MSELSNEVPKVICEKPPLPTLWLDTSVVIKLAKIARGEALQEIEVSRCTRLQRLVFDLVRDGKLLCPESDQGEEYAPDRLDDDVHGTFARLSLGISMTHRQGIFDQHVLKGMEAFAKRTDVIHLACSSYFHGDPIRRLEQARHEKFIVTVGPLKTGEIIKRRAISKANIGRQWEQLRQELVAKGQTYQKQFAIEQQGEAQAMLEALRRFETNLLAARYDFFDFMAASGPLRYRHYWKLLHGEPPDWEGVFRFFGSPYFNQLPIPLISSCLIAELLTGNEGISTGDPMDVELLAVALPMAHFVLTDRRMETRIKKLGLDTKCAAKVYSMSTIEELFANLESLHANQSSLLEKSQEYSVDSSSASP